MTPFTIISSIILLGLTVLCFWLPSRNGQEKLGLVISLTLSLIIIWTLIGQLDFLVIFIWPLILTFQLVFLTYWTLRNLNRPQAAIFSATILTLLFALLALQPWITDWTFNKDDAREMLSWHDIQLNEDFEIVKNESGGFTDYAHSFRLKISQADYDRIANKIRSSKNYEGLITDLTNQLPTADYKSTDTINYETENHIEREYYTNEKKEDGTFHFFIQLSKKKRELNYLGINE